MSGLSGSVVSATSSVNWAWSGVELADVSSVGATVTVNESLLVVVFWSLSSSSVSVALTVTNIVGEEIELRVVDSLVVNVLVVVDISARDVDTLEPVESHGVEDLVNCLAVADSSLKSSDDSIGLSVKSIVSVLKVFIDS